MTMTAWQMTAVHREEGLSQYRAYDSRGQLIAVKDTQGHETRYEYNIAGDLTAVIAPDGSRNGHSTMRGERPSVPRRAG
ncbi:hypothetical protein ECZU13_38770 [Escherichia coli]|nr:hypothetical protein ECZU13_38770 [Escherichia coli]